MKKQPDNNINIQFLGAAGTVTGSKHLVTTPDKKIMIDCGLFQGLKELRLLNWEEFPVNPQEIDCIILTHAHLDHVGYLPRLVKQGFKGKVYCTAPTADIAEVVLLDSAKIQEEDAEMANNMGYSKHEPAEPLYGVADARRAVSLFNTVGLDEWISLGEDIRFRMKYVGHILGAAYVDLEIADTRIVFSGDVGRRSDLTLKAPDRPTRADYLVVESTYGDRLHSDVSTEKKLKDVINAAYNRGGSLIIPSFTVDRAQDLVWLIWSLKKNKEIPNLPLYLDSPMGVNVSKIFCRYDDWHKLGPDIFDKAFESVSTVSSPDQTLQVSARKEQKIVVAGSGMMNGGRVLLYLMDHVKNPDDTVLITGYQAEGTRGRALQQGAHEIKIHGNYYPVRAHIEEITTMSSHADQAELLDWMSAINHAPKTVFIVHGEKHSADALRLKIKDTFHWQTAIPKLDDVFPIF